MIKIICGDFRLYLEVVMRLNLKTVLPRYIVDDSITIINTVMYIYIMFSIVIYSVHLHYLISDKIKQQSVFPSINSLFN